MQKSAARLAKRGGVTRVNRFGAQILTDLGTQDDTLAYHNSKKVIDLPDYGLDVAERTRI